MNLKQRLATLAAGKIIAIRFCVTFLSIVISHGSFAQLSMNENFSYTIGSKIDVQSGWGYSSSPSSSPILVSSAGLSYSGYGNSAIGSGLQVQNVNGEDVMYHFASPISTTGVSVYTAFLVNVASASVNPQGAVVTMGMGTTSFKNTGFTVRNSSGSLQIGIYDAYSHNSTFASNNLDFGTTYLIVLEYNFSTNTIGLYLNPTIDQAQPGSILSFPMPGGTSSSLGGLLVQQNAAGVMVLDGMRLSTNWSYAVSSNANGSGGASGTNSLPYVDEFEYTAGQSLTSQNTSWTAFSQAGVNPVAITAAGQTYSGLLPTGGSNSILLQNSTSTDGEDVRLTHQSVAPTSGPIYYAFLLKINAYVSGSSTINFASLNGSGSGSFSASYLTLGMTSPNYSLRIGSSTQVPLTYGITHLVVLKYDATKNGFSLFVDSASPFEATPNATYSVSPPSSINGINFYQSINSVAYSLNIDELHIGTSWQDIIGVTKASLPFSDSFEYTVGQSLTSQNPVWKSFAQAGVNAVSINNTGMTYGGYSTTGGNGITLKNATLSESVALPITAATGTIYTSFLLNVPAYSGVATINLFNVRGPDQAGSFPTTYVGMNASSGGYTLRVGGSVQTSTLSYGSTNLVVVKFDVSLGRYSIIVNSAISFEPSTTVTYNPAGTPPSSVDGIIFYQGTGVTSSYNVLLDEVHVGTSWQDVIGLTTASLPYFDSFEYTVGQSLISQNSTWQAYSQSGVNSVAVSNNGLTYSNYYPSGGSNGITLQNSSLSESIALPIPSSTGTVYTSFLIKVPAYIGGGGTVNLFNVHGPDQYGSFSTTYVALSTSAGGYQVRYAGAASSTLAYGVSNLVVIKFDVTSGQYTLFTNTSSPLEPVGGSSYGVSGNPTSVDGIIFYQGVSISPYAISIDELHVGTSWADIIPSSYGGNVNLIAEENFAATFGTPVTSVTNWGTACCGTAPTISSGSLAYLGYGSSGVGNSLTFSSSSGPPGVTFSDINPTSSIYASILLGSGSDLSAKFSYGLNSGGSNCSIFRNFTPGSVSATTSPTMVVVELDPVSQGYYYYVNPPINGAKPAPTSSFVGSWGAGCITDINSLIFQTSGSSTTIDGLRIAATWAGAVALETPAFQPPQLELASPITGGVQLSFVQAQDLPTGYLVTRKIGSPPTGIPSANSTYSVGDLIGDGVVVYSNGSSGTNPAGVISFTDVYNIASQTKYFYSFFSINALNGSTYYLTSSPTGTNSYSLSPELSSAVGGLGATSPSNAQINLGYNSVAGAFGYLILRRQDGTFPTLTGVVDGTAPSILQLPSGTTRVSVGAGDVTATTQSDTGLTSASQFNYAVIPYSYDGSNSLTYNYYTASVSTVIGLTRTDAPVSSYTVGGATDVTFTAQWASVTGATGYELDVCTSSNFDVPFAYQNTSMSSSSSSQSVSGLTANTLYYFRVRAKNSSGASANSANQPATTAPVPPSITGISTIESAFTMAWVASPAATGYYMDFCTDAGYTNFVSGYNNKTVDGTAGSFSAPSANTTYYGRFRSSNSNGTSNSTTFTLTTSPLPPTVNSASSFSQTSFVANWSASTGAISYRLDVATSSNFASGTFVSGYNNLTVSGISSTVSGLSPGSTYYYQVRSVNAGGTSTSSTFTSAVTVPPNPTLSSVVPIDQSSFTANWNQTTSATGYFLDVSADNFSTYVTNFINRDVSNTLTFNVTGLSAGTNYTYRVRAYNGSGTSGNSPVSSPVLTYPPNPSLTAATSMTQTSFNANWNAALSASAYEVDVSTSPTFSSFLQKLTSLSGTSVSISGLTPGNIYYYQVRAVNSSGKSGNSSAGTSLTVPPNPQTATANLFTQTSFTANWSPSLSATSYRLDVSISNTFTPLLSGYNDLSVPNTSQSVTGLEAGTTYYYRVRAVNASGTSTSTGYASGLTAPPDPTATNASNPTTNSFTANWNPATGATGYKLDVADNPGFQNPIYNAKDIPNAQSASVTGLNAGTRYYYRIKAYNISGPSVNYSPTVSQITVCDPPTPLDPTSVLKNSFIAKWSPVIGVVTYELSVADFTTNALVAGYPKVIPSDQHADVVQNVQPKTEYKYFVRAINDAGPSAYSDIQLAYTLDDTGGVFDPPSVSVNEPQSSVSSVQVQVTKGITPLLLTIKHRSIADSKFVSEPSVTMAASNTTKSVSISPTWVDELGMEYYFVVKDAAGRIDSSQSSFVYQKISVQNVPVLQGDFSGNWKMFSIPAEIANNRVDEIFSPIISQFGGYSKDKWKLYHYNSSSKKYEEYLAGLTSIVQGEGYWIIAANALSGIPINSSVVESNQTAPFTYTYGKGWNLIGNPYPFNIDWSKVQSASGNSSVGLGGLQVWESGQYNPKTVLKAWGAAFVFSDNGGTVSYPVTSRTLSGGRSANSELEVRVDDQSWKLPISLQLNGLSQTSAIGMSLEASQSKDKFDEIAVPRFVDFLEMTTYHKDFFAPHFSTDIVPTSTRAEWTFALASNQSGTGHLEWDNKKIETAESRLVLVDLLDGVWVDMKSKSSYTFEWKEGRQVKILYSRDGLIDPGISLLGQAYPNPFSSGVQIPLIQGGNDKVSQINIYDVLGRKVMTLNNDLSEPGIHNIWWDGKDDQGNVVSNGVLFYRSDSKSSSTKRIIKQ